METFDPFNKKNAEFFKKNFLWLSCEIQKKLMSSFLNVFEEKNFYEWKTSLFFKRKPPFGFFSEPF